jgi:ferrochelatase
VKTAIVLFNLGGPDSPEAVRPFLRNLFNDPAILRVPGFVRGPLAWLISTRRAPTAQKIYAQIGGASPILGQTEAQARALEDSLRDLNVRAFVCMRYWHPMTEAVVQQVRAYAPDRIVLLPLYPQYSTATTKSSLDAWKAEAGRLGGTTSTIESYPVDPGFIEASVDLIRQELARLGNLPRRILFSAHGLPEKIIKAGDPYQRQVEQTATAIASQLGEPDTAICYQSRVGPLKWIGPSTDEEIARAGKDGKAIVLYPLAFVSEHSETLVELDIEYRHLAGKSGVPAYYRVPTVGTHPAFIRGLADLVRTALQSNAQAT